MAKYSLSKGLARGVSWAPIGAKLGGPTGAALAFGAGALLGGQSIDDKLDTAGYYRGFDKYQKQAMRNTRRAANEVGAVSGAGIAARGINDSKLAAFLNQSARQNLYGRTLDQVNTNRANLEVQLAHAKNMLKQARSRDERDAWTQTANHLYDWLVLEHLQNLRVPNGTPNVPNQQTNNMGAVPPSEPGERPISSPRDNTPTVPAIPPYAPGAPTMPRDTAPEVTDPQPPQYQPPSLDSPEPETETDIGPMIMPETQSMGPGNGIFTRGPDGKVPTEADQIGLDLDGDPMYEGWEKDDVYTSPNGQRYPHYKRKSWRDDLPTPQMMNYSPGERQLRQEMGDDIADYLKQMLPDRYAEIFEYV